MNSAPAPQHSDHRDATGSPAAPPFLSVVIPVYRSASTLSKLAERLITACRNADLKFEILFVEDCGGDESWPEIQRLATIHPEVRGLQLSRNFGQHAATICGASHSRGQWVATIDDDLEQAPEDLLRLLDKAREGFDLVYGVYPTRSHSAWRNATSAIARRLFKAAIPSLNFDYTSLRVIDGNLARALSTFDSPSPFIDGYLSWMTNRYATVDVQHLTRDEGRSNYTFSKLLRHSINIFVAFSELPLRLASWLGFFAFLAGMLWLAAILLSKLLGGITVSGFTSVMAAITLFSGLQLLILGVIGEYVGRINFKSSNKPSFVVARTTSDAMDGASSR